jgi:F420-non-reducing hydrogenase large subunit
MTRITIDPVTRLEGHGKIEILLDDAGNVEHTYFQIPELRGFEAFCVGRPVEDMPALTNRICGVCPEAHHMAAAKAADAVYNVTPPRTGRMLRELLYNAFYVTDHATHFYVLSGPDLIMGPDAPKAERNILGVVKKVGAEVGKKVIDARHAGHRVIEIVGGRRIHPCTGVPGGMTKAISTEERDEIKGLADAMVEFASFSLDLFDQMIKDDGSIAELVKADMYRHETYYSGLVDENDHVTFYDGNVKVVAPDGEFFGSYEPKDYRDWIDEKVVPWTFLKFPYLKKVGWKGIVDGKDSGIFTVAPLGRLNVASGMATPKAQEAYEKYYAALSPDGSPVHERGATHWARLIEMMQAAETVQALANDPEIISPDVRAIPTEAPTEGVGIVEAPRGTLTHHYWTDDNGVVTRVNLIVGTTNNYGPIAMSVDKAARSLISEGTVVTDGLLDRIEMGFRAYDPCFGCATHTMPGQMPMVVSIRDKNGVQLQELRRD